MPIADDLRGIAERAHRELDAEADNHRALCQTGVLERRASNSSAPRMPRSSRNLRALT